MAPVQFTTLIRLPFARGSFEDPLQAQWDADKDRQLWKVISKSSKTSDLDWVDLASKFQVPPTFLLQQAAWLYERHLDHVRNQMKKVSGSSVPTQSGGSTLTATGGVAMRRTGSGGSGSGQRTTSALLSRPRDSPNLRGGETVTYAPPLSRTPSTNTITQSRAITQQVPIRTQSMRSVQRANLSSPTTEARRNSVIAVPSSKTPAPAESPEIPAASSSSSSSSSFSDADHPAHRSQLFKRPPRFKQHRPRDLATFDEAEGAQEADEIGSQGLPNLPFASAARPPGETLKFAQDTLYKATNKSEPKSLQTESFRPALHSRQKSVGEQSQVTTETASSMTSSASASDALAGPKPSGKPPVSPHPNHRAELARLGSPRGRGPRSRREGSEGTPSMGSSFSDIDDAGISQSALEEALLSNMQHGRMSTLSRMSRYL